MFRRFHSRTGPVHMKPHIHLCVINHFHLYGLLHFSQSHHYHLLQSPPISTWQSRQEQTETANRKVKGTQKIPVFCFTSEVSTLASLARFASASSWIVWFRCDEANTESMLKVLTVSQRELHWTRAWELRPNYTSLLNNLISLSKRVLQSHVYLRGYERGRAEPERGRDHPHPEQGTFFAAAGVEVVRWNDKNVSFCTHSVPTVSSANLTQSRKEAVSHIIAELTC